MLLRALIVDDEYPAREELRCLLSRCACIEIVGEAADAREAMKLIRALDYDVVFLDICMPGISGIDLVRELRALKKAPGIVFVTAYEEYAVEAFTVGAVDYLVKPISEERLMEVVARLKERLKADKNGSLAFLAVEKGGNIIPVPTHNIPTSMPRAIASLSVRMTTGQGCPIPLNN